jgi:hypothetical protein
MIIKEVLGSTNYLMAPDKNRPASDYAAFLYLFEEDTFRSNLSDEARHNFLGQSSRQIMFVKESFRLPVV